MLILNSKSKIVTTSSSFRTHCSYVPVFLICEHIFGLELLLFYVMQQFDHLTSELSTFKSFFMRNCLVSMFFAQTSGNKRHETDWASLSAPQGSPVCSFERSFMLLSSYHL